MILNVQHLGKSFLVPRRKASATGQPDPRRERYSLRRDRFRALEDISFAIGAGQCTGLIGSNGSGKSTLLKILAGVMQPDHGSSDVQGRVGALLELGAGFHPDLTGIENVYLNGSLLGLSGRQIDQALPGIIAFAELEQFMDLPVKHFSSGMTARLGFAVATQLAPEMLLMDETFATGDAWFQAKALAHIARLKAGGHTLLLVSHNMELILQLADQVLWLDKGRLHGQGAPREILVEYRRQRGALEGGVRLRNALGRESVFEPLAANKGSGQACQIEEASLGVETENGVAWIAPGEIGNLQQGGTVLLRLAIVHPTRHNEQSLLVETAWQRNQDKLLAQSCTRILLKANCCRTEVVLRFADWPLTEATWSPAVSISPIGEDAADRGMPVDRKILSESLRVITPNPYELPTPFLIPNCWQI